MCCVYKAGLCALINGYQQLVILITKLTYQKKLKLANIQLNTAKKNKPLLFRHVGPKVDSGLKHPRPPPLPVSSRPPPSPSPPKPVPSPESSSLNSEASVQQREQVGTNILLISNCSVEDSVLQFYLATSPKLQLYLLVVCMILSIYTLS